MFLLDYTQYLKDIADYNTEGYKFSAAIFHPIHGWEVFEVNRVITTGDPTAHAEITAIRRASELHGSLDGAVIVSSGEPCPMCLTAIAWAGIKTVYYIRGWEEADENNDYYDQDCEKVNEFLHLGLTIRKL